MTSDVIEREQAACRAAAESRGIDCGKHDWEALAEEQEQLRARLEQAEHDIRKSWPEFKQKYVHACQSKIIGDCSGKTLNLLKAIIDTKNPIPSPPDFVQNVLDGFAVGHCAVDVLAPLFTEGTSCLDQATQIHSRILNDIISQKHDAERRRDEFMDWDAKAGDNPECQCQVETGPEAEAGSQGL